MPEITQVRYSHVELATIFIRQQGIHEGHWMIAVEFQTNIGNYTIAEGVQLPGAINLIKAIGLQRVEEASPLSVDAAVVNPAGLVAIGFDNTGGVIQ